MDKNNPLRINYARPSFLEGMARALDLGGTLDDYDVPYLDDLRAGRIPPELTKPESDVAAMRQDWIAVGQYIRGAMNGVTSASGAADKKRLPQ